MGAPGAASERAFAIRRQIERARTIGLSCPKAGRSWIGYFIASYVASQTGNPIDLDLLSGSVLPPLVFVHEHLDVFEDVAGPTRLLNEDLLQRRRIIVLVRDPRDSLVSYWHHKRARERRPVADRLEVFAHSPVYGIERISQGTALLLDLHERHRGDKLLVTYEDLSANPERRLREVLRFALDGHPRDEPACRIALAASRFDAMRAWERRLTRDEARTRYSNRFGPSHEGARSDEAFKVRRGEVGGFATEMPAELWRHLTALPHTHALLERLASVDTAHGAGTVRSRARDDSAPPSGAL
jgi:hypothetical protein